MNTAIAAVCALALLAAGGLRAQPINLIELKLDASEAEAVLSILDRRAAQQSVTDGVWQALFSTVPYQRLKTRSLEGKRLHGRRNPTLCPDSRCPPRLAATATLRAKLYPLIKPQSNSFVFDTGTDPAIALYLDPKISPDQFENTVAHELHHIGLSSLDEEYEKRILALPETAREAARRMGAFGESVAVLAAAGSPGVAPLSAYPQRDQIDWDLHMERVEQQLQELNQFFLDAIHGDLRNDAVAHEGSTFFGYRGPWYTVGYLMATTIEKQYGRPALVETLQDYRQFVSKYNEAASTQKTPRFGQEILEAVTGR